MPDGGKGSRPRPYSVSQEEFDNRWDAIFGKKKVEEKETLETKDKDTDVKDKKD